MLPSWVQSTENSYRIKGAAWYGYPPGIIFRNARRILDRLEDTPSSPPPGMIAGVTTVTGTPASQRVRVYRRSDGALVGETLSAEDGTYQVTGLDPEETHYVVALHTTLEYNAVVADNITPEGGP